MRRRTALVLPVSAALAARASAQGVRMRRGFNVIQDTAAPFGSPAARESFRRLARTGADAVAIVPFLWQATPDASEVVRGSDMTDARRRRRDWRRW
jgi:hypothetical protein